eukprot:EC725268.1.p1 GENE.EC725268.1~~EC725268.1.p1  ORF type:complete len:79 (+),score=0.05 EC725268.1:105-341(+)
MRGMRGFGASSRLEWFKFALYLGVPVGVVYFFSRPSIYMPYLERKQFVVYPPEGERPPENLEEIKKRADAQMNVNDKH